MLPYDVWIKTQEFMGALSKPSRFKHHYRFLEEKTIGPVAGPFEKFEDPETGEILYRHKKTI